MNAMLSDLKHGLRVLVRTPLFTICTVAALAIGIGSTTALFSVVNAMLLKPLPYADADQLLVIWEHNLPRNRTRNVVNVVNFMGWRDRAKSFDGMAALQQNRVTLTGSGEPMELSTLIVTANMFDVLGASPMIGRAFLSGEDQSTSERTMLLSHGLWVRHFGGAASVLGTRVVVNGEPVLVIGVMPPGFEILGQQADAITPFRFSPQTGTGGRSLVVIGRMKPGVTRDQAQAELEGVMTGLRNERPDFNTGWAVNAVPLREQLVGDIRPALLALFGAVGAVLLIACGNIGSLMLTRASGRRRELAIRAAVGAGTGRLLTQLVCEAFVLAIAGGLLGVIVARWLLTGLTSWVSTRLPLAAPRPGGDRSDRADLRGGDHDRDHAGVRIGAGDWRHRRLARDGTERRRADDGGQRARAIGPPGLRDRRDRVGAHGVVRRRTARPQPDAAPGRRSWVSTGVRTVVARHAAATQLCRLERAAHVSHADHRGIEGAAWHASGRRHVVPAAGRHWTGDVVLAGRSAATGAERSPGGRRAAGDRGLLHGDGHSGCSPGATSTRTTPAIARPWR